MKRRDFFTSSAIVGASIPLGIAPMLSSCSNTESKSKITYTPEGIRNVLICKESA